METVRLAKLLPKGQVTIPKDVREALGAEEGDIIVFRETGGVWTIDRQPANLVEFMQAIGRQGRSMSPDELEEIDATGRFSEDLREKRYEGE
jgi:AbrB family looped-hinge helix DNA binding protein